MTNKRRALKINRKHLEEAGKKINEAIELLSPYFDIPFQRELWGHGKIDAETIEFIVVTHNIAEKYPEFLPPFLDMKTFSEDLALVHELQAIACSSAKMYDKINNKLNINGNRCMEIARAIHNNLKIAAKRDIPGARLIFDELVSALPSKKKKLGGGDRK